MKNSTIISIIALLVALVGVLISLVAYFKKRNCTLCDDLDDMVFDEDGLDYGDSADTLKADDAPAEEKPAE